MKNNKILTQTENALGIKLYDWQKEYIHFIINRKEYFELKNRYLSDEEAE